MTADNDVMHSPAPGIDDDQLQRVATDTWGLPPGLHVRRVGSERDLTALLGDAGVLKVFNPAEEPGAVEMEAAALRHLATVDPTLPVPRTLPTTEGALVATVVDASGRPCLAQLTSLLPGQMLEGSLIDETIAEHVGELAARTSLALQGFFHHKAGRDPGWDIRRLPSIAERAGVPGSPLRTLVERVGPALVATRSLPSAVQHADVTLTNILVAENAISGLVDLGDMHHTAAVCDLAATITSVLRNTAPEQVSGTWHLAGAVLRGYQRHRLLLPEEVDVLGELILARLALTEVISTGRADDHPDNRDYITRYDQANRRVLDELSALDPGDLRQRLARRAGTARAPRPGPATTGSDLLDRRRKSMGGALSPLFYRRPLEVSSGQGPWLVRPDGTRYLDAYNNVAVVGHAHPAITQAVTRQFAVLNTHSRYLHPRVVELAERILATMPAGLDTCLFTTSGSEANELAWRMASAYTGGRGAIVAEHAYHGATAWLADLSSSEWPPGHRPARVATFAAPHGLNPATAAGTAHQRVLRAAETLNEHGDRPALVLADPMFTSEGILDVPAGFLGGLITGAHAAGALFLADEVQSGYGRTGPQLWRFAHHEVEPDLVTLGKPMAAGYPVGAVITRREIADALAQRYEYFSTFAATPVAAAAGLAVLDVLQDDDLPALAVTVGDRLRGRLRDLRARHPVIADVRGVGLIAGVSLRDPSAASNGSLTSEVVERLHEHHILAGRTGPDGDVLKIRPPLVWRDEHVDRLVDVLDQVLGSVPGPAGS